MRGLCICFLFVLLTGCEKATTSSEALSAAPSPSVSPQKLPGASNLEAVAAKFDVCGLLKTEEIQAIVGSTIIQSNGSGQSNGRFRISQCVYLASQSDRSVSLVVTQADPLAPQKGSPKDFWRERFGHYREEKNEKEERERERRRAAASSNRRLGRRSVLDGRFSVCLTKRCLSAAEHGWFSLRRDKALAGKSTRCACAQAPVARNSENDAFVMINIDPDAPTYCVVIESTQKPRPPIRWRVSLNPNLKCSYEKKFLFH